MKRKRGALKLWTAILLTFVGILAIVGGTVLVLFFMGRLSDEVIEPEIDSLSFEQTIDGLGYYDDSLSSSNSSYYKVSSDFQMTITCSTEGVTVTGVTLNLGTNTTSAGDGYITDGIITVPQQVTLNVPFTVTLNQSVTDGTIIGGASTLTAISEGDLANRPVAHIFVDVPVTSMSATASGALIVDDVQEVVVGTTFYFETTYTPSSSAYLFSDSSTQKELFYNVIGSSVSVDYETGIFTALSNGETTISVYSFINSYYQKLFMDTYSYLLDSGDYEGFNNEAITYFNNNPGTWVVSEVTVRVGDVTVTDITLKETSFSITADTKYILTTSSSNGNGSLGLQVLAGNEVMTSLVGRSAIKITQEILEAGITIVGGKVIKVVQQGETVVITQETYDSTKDYSPTDTTTYYIQPNTTPKEYSNYYWQITSDSSNEVSATTSVNYFYQDSNGVWQALLDFEEEKGITISVSLGVSATPSWSSSDSISIEINYDSNNQASSEDIDLSALLNEIDSSSVYRKVVYFLYSSDRTLDLTEYFVCKTGVMYDGLSLDSSITTEYTLYEVEGSILSALKAFSSETTVKVFAAIVRTDADNNIIYDSNGKYTILSYSSAKTVDVESVLSIYNMTPTFTFSQSVNYSETAGQYYISAFNVDSSSGSQETMLTFTLTLSINTDSDADKLLTAYSTGNLTVVCLDTATGREVDYIKLASLSLDNENTGDGQAIFSGVLQIDETACTNDRASLENGIQLGFELRYYDGKTEQSATVVNSENSNITSFIFYSPYPTTLVGAYESFSDSSGTAYSDATITVSQTSSGTTIKWGEDSIANIDRLNELLSFTMTDQYGFEIDSSDEVYSVYFSESKASSSANSVLGISTDRTKIDSFGSGEDVETTLVVQIIDKKDNNTAETGDGLTKTIKFNVTSEGISKIEKSTSEIVENSYDTYVDNGDSITTVTISKYVTFNNVETLNNLVRIYTDSSVNQAEITFTFNSSTYTSNSLDSLLRMVTFYDSSDSEISADDFSTKSVYSIKFNGVFNRETTLTFTITDSAGLFTVTLQYICMPMYYMADAFLNYTSEYEDYLVSSGNDLVASVFADNSYDITEYINVSKLYSGAADADWSDMKANEIFSTENGDLLTLDDDLSLKISAVYQFRTVTFTLYFGVASDYGLRIRVTLYINPNVIIEEKVTDLNLDPLVNLAELSSTNVTSIFNFYKATSYINGSGSPEKIDDFYSSSNVNALNANLTFESVEGGYLKIENSSFSLNENIYLDLGEFLSQTFNVLYDNSEIAGIRVRVVTGDDGSVLESEYILCDNDTGVVELSIRIGYGSSEADVVETIFGTDLQTVQYNGETYLLLVSGETYTLSGNFSVSETVGNFGQSLGTTLIVQGIDSFLSFDNKVTVVNGDETIYITIPVIISKLGDTIFNYTGDDESFNKFTNADGEEVDFSVLLGSASDLEGNGVYATLTAGTTNIIIHNLSKSLGAEEDNKGVGIYYYSDKLTSITQSLTIYSVSGTLNGETVALNNLATVTRDSENNEWSLTLKHLSDSYTNVYVVLEYTFAYSEGLSDETLTIYFRIKVEPSFTAGTVTYPYADSAEYFDTNSTYYSDGTFTINLDETLNSQNSRYSSGTRFSSFEFLENISEDGAITSEYSIIYVEVGGIVISTGAYSQYFDYSISDANILTITPKTDSVIEIIIQKVFKVDGEIMIGSELSYTMIFNNSVSYTPSITSTSVEVTSSGNEFYSTVQAGSGGSDNNEISYFVSLISGSAYVDFGVNVTGDYEKALQPYVLAGTTVTLTEGGKYTFEETTIATINDDGTTASAGEYTFKVDGVEFAYATLTSEIGAKTLTLSVKDSVDKDYEVTLVFYTDRAVFTLHLTVTGIYSYEVNDIEFTGGNSYSLVSQYEGEEVTENGILSSLVGSETATIQISLADDVDSNLDDYWTVEGLSAGENGYSISSTDKIVFAHLTKDTTFKFEIVINNEYTFTIEITVKASLSTDSRTYNSGESYYSATKNEVNIDDDDDDDDLLSSLADNATAYDGTSGFAFEEVDESYTTSTSFTAESVGVTSRCFTTFTIAYFFNEKLLYSFELRYYYTCNPNVSVSVNYPQPDGENDATYTTISGTTLSAEYISTNDSTSDSTSDESEGTTKNSVTIENFFTSTAPLASDTRIAVEYLTEKVIDETWVVSIKELSNLTVNGQSDGTLSNYEELTFKFNDGMTQGYVTFTVSVNSVTVEYTVVVISSALYSFANYIPETDTSGEVIYAEDLAALLSEGDTSSVLEIFAQDRILSYTLAQAGTYYVRFVNSEDGKVEIITISGTSDNVGTRINQDLGKSLTGYEYDGTYSSYNSVTDTVSNLCDDSTIYSSAPILAGRVVVRYADGSIIALAEHEDENISLYYVYYDSDSDSDLSEDLSDYTLGVSTDILQTIKLSFKIGDNEIITGYYYYTLKLDFTVGGNADSATEYTTYEINAGTSISLLSDTQSAFAIGSLKTGELYSASDISNNNATLTLEVYGFKDLPVDTSYTVNNISNKTFDDYETQLSAVAGAIHNYLTSTTFVNENSQYYKYYTGLTPRPNATINEINSGNNTRDYITISQKVDSQDRTITQDWTITAQGANNDGNYVMIRVTYSVELGETKISSSHNILFKVLPNSTVSFSTSAANSSGTISGDTSMTNEYQTYVSNILQPYEINNSDISPSETIDIDLYQVIRAYMRGSSSNQISTFENWTISLNEIVDGVTYNNDEYVALDSSDSVLSLSSSSWSLSVSGSDSEKSYTYSNSSSATENILTLSESSLGEKMFYVEFKDGFGFVGRFYFKVVSEDDPEIYTLSSYTLTEGDLLAFTAQYQIASPITTSGYYRYDPFTYVQDDEAYDYITISGASSTIDYRLQLTLNSSLTVETGTSSITLPMNTVLERTGETKRTASEDEIFTVSDGESGTDWSYTSTSGTTTTITLTQAQLESAAPTVTLYLNMDEKDDLYTVSASSTTSSITLNLTYSTGSLITPTVYSEYETLRTVTFSGITAYAFTSNSAIDQNSVINQNLISNVNSLTVTKVTFTYNSGTISDTKTASSSSDSLKFLTSSEVSFVTSSYDIDEGEDDATDNTVTVPTFNGIDFGTSDVLSGVIMTVTVSNGDETCEVTTTVNIRRKVSTDDIFSSTVVLDGESVTSVVKSSISTGTLLNDTLEVDLDGGESMTLVVHNKKLTYSNGNYYVSTSDTSVVTGKTYYTIEETGAVTAVETPQTDDLENYYEVFTPNYVTITNLADYAVTEYVGISQSMADGVLTKNMTEDGDEDDSTFYVYVHSYTDSNGNDLLQGSETVSEKTPTIYYNGYGDESVVTSGSKKSISTLAEDALKLNIENTAALTNNQMTKRLYFLYTSDEDEGGQTYQIQQEFTVKPYYIEATATNVDSITGAIIVDANSDNTYDLSAWASEIYLTAGNATTGTKTLYNAGSDKEDSNKFYFDIEEGNAEIDNSSGTITTSMGPSEYIIVNVYIKVSGIDGYWDADNGYILIGTFQIRLEYTSSTSASMVTTSNVALADVQTEYVTNKLSTSLTVLDTVSDETEIGKLYLFSDGEVET